MRNIVPLEEVGTFFKDLNKKKVLVGGCFDLVHYGHLQFLKKAKKQGEVLIICLESDEFIKRKKNKVSFHTQTQRAEILAAFHMVDVVVLLPFLSTDEEYFQVVQTVRPQIIAVTEGDSQLKNKQKQAALVGAEV
ncbi:nucleotidyltransferase family protein, partial [Candidatus Roizmanbacteria bacterium]|nr:nucleotidyltransferase family protein [Candidatus Roizmanbacteria bacterium]